MRPTLQKISTRAAFRSFLVQMVITSTSNSCPHSLFRSNTTNNFFSTQFVQFMSAQRSSGNKRQQQQRKEPFSTSIR